MLSGHWAGFGMINAHPVSNHANSRETGFGNSSVLVASVYHRDYGQLNIPGDLRPTRKSERMLRFAQDEAFRVSSYSPTRRARLPGFL